MHCVGVGDLGEEKVLVQLNKIYLYSKPRRISSSDKCKRDCPPQKRTNQLDQSRLPAGEFRFMFQETFPKQEKDFKSEDQTMLEKSFQQPQIHA